MPKTFPEYVTYPTHRVYHDGTILWTPENGEPYILEPYTFEKYMMVAWPTNKRVFINLKKIVFEAYYPDIVPDTRVIIHHLDKDFRNCRADNLYINQKDINQIMVINCRSEYLLKSGFKCGRYPYSRYAAHTDGTIYNMQLDTLIVGSAQGEYLKCGLFPDDSTVHINVPNHRFVLFCHDEDFDISSSLEVNHIDGDTFNNAFSNLEKVTSKEHAKKTHERRTDLKALQALAKRKPILRTCTQTGVVTRYESMTIAAHTCTLNPITIRNYINNGNQQGSYTWRWDLPLLKDEKWYIITHNLPEDHHVRGLINLAGLKVSSAGRLQLIDGRVVDDECFKYKGVKRYIHAALCYAWWGEPPTGTTVDHMDGDHDNNDPRNLMWATKKQQNLNKSNVNKVERTCRLTGKALLFDCVAYATKSYKHDSAKIAKLCNNEAVDPLATWKFIPLIRKMRPGPMPEPDFNIVKECTLV